MNLQETLLAVEQDGQDAGWDGPVSGPMLFEVVRQPNGELVYVFPRELNETFIRLTILFGEQAGRAALHLAEAAEMARSLWEKAELPLPTELVGLGVRSEAWDLVPLGSESWEEAEAHASEREVECRFVHFFERSGAAWHVFRRRGEAQAQIEEVTEEEVTGGLPHGLTRMLNAMVPEDVPVRELHCSHEH